MARTNRLSQPASRNRKRRRCCTSSIDRTTRANRSGASSTVDARVGERLHQPALDGVTHSSTIVRSSAAIARCRWVFTELADTPSVPAIWSIDISSK